MTQLCNHNTLSGAERTGVGGSSGLGHRALSCWGSLFFAIYFQLRSMTSSIARPGLSLPTPTPGCQCWGGGWGGAGGQGESENTVGGGGRREQGDTNTSSLVPLVKARESE